MHKYNSLHCWQNTTKYIKVTCPLQKPPEAVCRSPWSENMLVWSCLEILTLSNIILRMSQPSKRPHKASSDLLLFIQSMAQTQTDMHPITAHLLLSGSWTDCKGHSKCPADCCKCICSAFVWEEISSERSVFIIWKNHHRGRTRQTSQLWFLNMF